MTLRRSVGALASMHIFYKADIVVFCEGGQPKAYIDAIKYSNDGRTLDGVFWSSIMSIFIKDKKLHYKSIGSKPTLLAISNDIHNSGINSVTVCLDSDYDRILGRHSVNSRLAYTWGYSWETDVLQGPIIEEILITLVGQLPSEVVALLETSIAQVEKDLARWCEIDIALRHRDKPSVFDRKHPLASVDLTTFPLSVAHARLAKRLAEECGYTRRPKRIKSVEPGMVRRVAFGKLISKTYYHLLISLAKSLMSDVRIEYDNVMRLAINFTVRDIISGKKQDLRDHYSAQLSEF